MVSRLSATARRIKELSFLKPSDEDAPQNSERLGKPSAERPAGCLLWMAVRNGADAGSVLSLCKELSFLREEPVQCLVTTESDAPLVPSVARAVIHQLTPVETQGSIQRFLSHWTPDIAIFLGDVDAPRLARAALETGIPMFHVARDRSDQKRFPSYLAEFKHCLAASAAEARTMKDQLGEAGAAIEITGPLTDTVHALPCNEAECDELGRLLGGRPVWLAASVYLEEIAHIEAAHRRAFRAAHRMLLILVPAELDEAPEMRAVLDKAGWSTGLRSLGDEPDAEVQVYIADTEEELGLWYRLAPTSFIGGSFLADRGTADPFDAAALGSAVLHGPHPGDTLPRFQRLAAAGGCLAVSDAEDLGEAIQTLLAPDKAAALAQAGWSVTTESAAVVERLVELMDIALEEA